MTLAVFCRSAATGFFAMMAFAPGALAQVAIPYVPPELHQERRWVDGEEVKFCIWSISPTAALDGQIAQAIADTLLLEARLVPYEDPGVLTLDDFWAEIFIQLGERCDAIMGFALSSELGADWLVPSRPYYEAPFVLAVTNPDYQKLGDIPAGKAIGSLLYTAGDTRMLEYQSIQTPEQSWRRFPLTQPEQGLDFLRRGLVEGAVYWAPTLHALTGGDPAGQGIRTVPLVPVRPAATPIGMILREHNAFLRNQLDQAIAALITDGVITEILSAAGMPGSAGGE